jgi:hypothetical protein
MPWEGWCGRRSANPRLRSETWGTRRAGRARRGLGTWCFGGFGLEGGFGGFYGGEGFYQGVDAGVAHDGGHAGADAGEEEDAALFLGSDEVVRDEAEAGGVDVGDAGEVEDQDLGVEGAELGLEGEHGGEGERSGEGENGGSLRRSRRRGVDQRRIRHGDSVRARLWPEVTRR